jgi:hypothetical protein
VLPIPDNHEIPLFDLPTRLLRPYAHYTAAFGSELEPVHRSADWLVLGVNTTRAWRHKHGEVSAAQVERVARTLQEAAPGQLRVVVVHQPAAVARAQDATNLLRGRAEALARWAAAGADVVMGGHIHLPYVLPQTALARPLWVVQAGTAVSARVRAGVPNSVNLLRWDGSVGPGPCSIEQWDYAAGSRCFERVRTTLIEPAR